MNDYPPLSLFPSWPTDYLIKAGNEIEKKMKADKPYVNHTDGCNLQIIDEELERRIPDAGGTTF